MALKVWWKLDESDKGDGATVFDSSGFGNHGTYEFPNPLNSGGSVMRLASVTGEDSLADGAAEVALTPTFGAGQDTPGEADAHKTKASFDFDISFPNNAPFTVESWIQCPTTYSDQANRGMLGAGVGAAGASKKNWGWRMDYQQSGGPGNGPAYFSFFRGKQHPSGPIDNLQIVTNLGDDAWHLIRTTYDGATMKVYIDNAFAGSMASSLTLESADGGFWVGGTTFGVVVALTSFLYAPTVFLGGSNFKGTYFDNVRIWDVEAPPPSGGATLRASYGVGQGSLPGARANDDITILQKAGQR